MDNFSEHDHIRPHKENIRYKKKYTAEELKT